MEYLLHVLVLIAVYGLAAGALNLVVGYAGMLSMAHAGFFGVGAYLGGLLAVHWGWPFPACFAAAGVLSGLFGALTAAAGRSLREDSLMIATFAFQALMFQVFNNWVDVTGGPMGLAGIPRPAAFGWVVETPSQFLVLALGCLLAGHWFLGRLVSAPFGRVLKVIREDEGLALALGKDVARFKVISFAISAAIAGGAGCLYAFYVGFIDPASFTVWESILVLSMVIAGGAGSLAGPVLGAALVVSLPEVLRLLGLPGPVAANVRQMLYGAALVALMAWRPQGLLGRFDFRADWHDDRA